MIIRVTPVVDLAVRGLCPHPYPLHPKGCPNFGKRATCPPMAPLLPETYDLSGECYLIVNRFALSAHVERMRVRNPDWSQRQLECCLYWQGTARAQLDVMIREFRREHPRHYVTRCPEAMGLDVTRTLDAAYVDIEWPPRKFALQVAFAAPGRHA